MRLIRFAAAVAMATALAGCQNPAETGTPGANNNGTATPGNQTGTPVGTAAAFFTKGKVWEYGMATNAAGTAMAGDLKIEVSDVSGDTATIKTTVAMAGQPATTNTSTVKLNEPDALAKAQASGNGDFRQVSSGKESVTVPAGTYNATKTVLTRSDDQSDSTVTYWIDDAVGMVKEIVEVKPKTAMPNIPGMPAGMDFSSKTTIELKSVK